MTHTLTRGALAAALGLSLALAWALSDSQAQTSVGTAFTYQGRLASGGAPVNGACDFQFSLWNAASGGAQIGSTQTYTNTGVSAGYFTIADLDFGAGAFNGQARWLEIEVRCPAGSGSYTALSPRQALTATPYAHSLRPGAVVSGTLANDSILFVRNTAGTGSSSGVYGRSDSTAGYGMYGLANAASGTTYGVYGRSNSTAGYGMYGLASAISGWTYGVYGQSDSTSGRGVHGFAGAASGWTHGVYGQSDSTGGHGVYGLASAASGVNFGVFGQSNSIAGYGMYGLASATSGTTYGVYGQSNSTDGTGVYGMASAISGVTYGVYGQSNSTAGYGMYGWSIATSGNTVGVFGRSNSVAGTGVYGLAGATSGVNYGVYGQSNSLLGYGMYGRSIATSGSGAGVYGQSDSTAGRGVYGYTSATSGLNFGVFGQTISTDGRGVYGLASATSGTNVGVYGRSDSTSGYAGYFQSTSLTGTVAVYARGNIQSTGLIVGAAKAFIMDHPTDPANKYLYHFAQEGPAVQNVYNGVVTLNAAGEATVTLPDYFAAANAGPFLYQLTPIGAAMPNLHIAQKIAGNRFRIAGGIPGMEVSWEVTATRSDPTTRSLNLATEVDKPAGEKGAYLHPQAFGQPLEKGLDYQRNAALHQPSPESPTAGGDR